MSDELPARERYIAALHAEVVGDPSGMGYAKLSPEEVCELLHRKPEIPVTPPPIAAPLTLEGVMGSLSAESIGGVLMLPCFTDIRDKVLAQDRVGVGLYAQVLAMGGKIKASEAQAITALLTATQQPPDVITYGKSRFDTELRYQPEFPNKVRPADVVAAREYQPKE